MRYRITAPVEGATCTVAGVAFANSVAETDNPGAVAYFVRHGYQVDEIPDPASEALADANDPAADGDSTPPAPVRPAKSASTEVWRDYAKASGMDAEKADSMSRDDLVAHYEAQDKETK